MADIKRARRRFTAVAIVLVCLDLLSVGVLLSPIGRGARAGQHQVLHLWSQLRAKDQEVLPLKNIDKKVVEAKTEISDFYDQRLPDSYASISEQLGQLANENHVVLADGRYDTKAAEIPGLTRVQVTATISGDYVQAVKFINALERDKTFFIVNSVAVSTAQGGSVRLRVQVETYLRSPEGA